MPGRTVTKMVSFPELKRKGDSATLIIKLMMAANDLSLVNEAQERFAGSVPADSDTREWGAGLYFIRLQLSHLVEGMAVIERIRESESLMALLNRCDKDTISSFESLTEYLPGGSKSERFQELVVRIRHNITFHYDETGKVIEKSLERLASKSSRPWSKITRGEHAYLWRFTVADRVVDSIICRDIWRIPPDAPLRETANENAQFVFEAFRQFVDFAGEFIWKYCSQN